MSKPLVCRLEHLSLIRVTGTDAREFLQGQLSNTITTVSPLRAQLSSYNSAKGRVLAVLRVFEFADALYLQLPRSLLDATLKRLRMFVLRSKVALEDASDALPGMGLHGPGAERLLAGLRYRAPRKLDDTVPFDGGTLIRINAAEPRFMLHAAPAHLDDFMAAADGKVIKAESGQWRLLDIRAGIPTVFPETQDMFVAQMLNLDTLNAIDFKKGCYTGQEIIARIHYLGKLKRRMHRATTTVADTKPGMPLYTDNGEESVGNVVDSAVDQNNLTQLLAVIQTNAAAESGLRLGSRNGPSVRIIRQ